MTTSEGNKAVLIGESGVGKTCIINQFMNKEFNENTFATIIVQFCRKKFEFQGNKNITLDIWDTAGQEKFRSLNRIFYQNAKAVILVYDITIKESFDEIKNYWYGQIKENCDNDVIIAIAANKSDLYEERKVGNEEGEEYAKSIGAFFASTSAKDDSGITSLFENIAMKILDPNFDFTANEQKIKEKFENKKKKAKIETENNKNNKDNSDGVIKLNTKKNKKKKC